MIRSRSAPTPVKIRPYFDGVSTMLRLSITWFKRNAIIKQERKTVSALQIPIGQKAMEISACKIKPTFYKSNTFAPNKETNEWTLRTTYWKPLVIPPWYG
jgi:hypothetical protein